MTLPARPMRARRAPQPAPPGRGRAPRRTPAHGRRSAALTPIAGRRARLASGDRRTQILAAALEVFAEQGFHGTRTRELAKRAGVSEALVFSHFPTKQALIRAIFDEVGFEQRIRIMEQRFGHMPPREALRSLAEHVLTNLRE